MNVIFLDYDGVVNIPMWNEDGTRCRYNFPDDNKVNHFQAVQWISEFCLKYDYKIVVSSTWRMDKNYKECLINGGLREGVEILGKTKILNSTRGHEIDVYLEEHPEITGYIIIDDCDDFTKEQHDRFVETRDDVGFMEHDYNKARRIHYKFNNDVGD